MKRIVTMLTAVFLIVGGLAGGASAAAPSPACSTLTHLNVAVTTRLDNTDGTVRYVSSWRVHPDASTNAGNCAWTDVNGLVGKTSKMAVQYQGYPEFTEVTVKAGGTKLVRVAQDEITQTLYRIVSTHPVHLTVID